MQNFYILYFEYIVVTENIIYYLTNLSNHNLKKIYIFLVSSFESTILCRFHRQQTGVRMHSHTLTAHSPHMLCSVLTK